MSGTAVFRADRMNPERSQTRASATGPRPRARSPYPGLGRSTGQGRAVEAAAPDGGCGRPAENAPSLRSFAFPAALPQPPWKTDRQGAAGFPQPLGKPTAKARSVFHSSHSPDDDEIFLRHLQEKDGEKRRPRSFSPVRIERSGALLRSSSSLTKSVTHVPGRTGSSHDVTTCPGV